MPLHTHCTQAPHCCCCTVAMADAAGTPPTATPPPFAPDLPADFVHQLLLALPLQDLLHAAGVCQLWCSVSARVWRVKALARWQHWSTPPAANADEAAWREPYRERHTADYEVLRLLADACWPHKQPATFQAIMERGADALDVLSAAARSRSASSMFIGTALHATCALMYLQAHLCGQQLQQLLASQVEPGSTSSSSDAQQPEPPPRDTAASSEREGAAAASGQDAMLEVALLLSQALHPLTDVAAVRRIISGLGAELQRRMHAARAAPGSRQALDLLNQLLFDRPPEAARQPPQEAGDAADGVARLAISGSSSNTGGRAGSAPPGTAASLPGWRAWSQQHQEVTDGADLSGFVVPTDGCTGIGLGGDTSHYYDIKNSDVGYVLATGCGLPITLCVLHRAVGQAGGLDIQLLNTPGHVVNAISFARTGSGGGSGGTAAVAADFGVVDPFDGGKELTDGRLSTLLRGGAPLLPPLQPAALRAAISSSSMSLDALAGRMVANMINATERLHQMMAPNVWKAAPELLAVPLVLLASRLQVLESFPDAQEALRALAPDIWTCEQLAGAGPVRQGMHSGNTPMFSLVTWRESRRDPWSFAPALVVSRPQPQWLLILEAPDKPHQARDHVRAVREVDTRLCDCAQPATPAAAVEVWAQGSYQAAYEDAQRLLRCWWFESSLPALLARLSGSGEPEQPWARLTQCMAAGKWVDALCRTDGGAACFMPNAYMQHAGA